jgi:molybdopterin converting factor subunit 1
MVKIKIMFFSSVKDELGMRELEMSLPQDAKVADVLAHLKRDFERLAPILERSCLAVNGEYATAEAGLHEGDEVAVLPPVSGG